MSDSRKKALWALSGLLFCVGAQAIVADSANPYQGIVDRNVFGLKPAPPSQKTQTEQPAAPKVTLTGITTIFGKPRALMSIQMPAKPPEPAKPQTFILQPGQRDGDVEVLEINEKLEGGTVKVSTFGTVQTLTMDKDGAKLPAGAPAPIPGMPNQVAFAPQPGMANPAAPAGGMAGMKPLPIRQLRVPESAANPGSPATDSGTPTTGFGAASVPTPVANSSQSPLSHEEQTIMLEAHYQIAKDQGDPAHMIFPPTEFDPTRNTTVAPGGEGAAPTLTPTPNPGPNPAPTPRLVPPIGTPPPTPFGRP